MRVAKGVGAAVLVMACALPSEASAVPVNGAYYAGNAPGQAQPSYVQVSADGRRLTAYLFAIHVSCSDGKAREFARNHISEKRFGLTADGRFDHQSRTQRIVDGRGRNRIAGKGSDRFVGSFAGDQVTLTVQARFAGNVTCNQDVPLTLRRVGSPTLRRGDSRMNTGRYAFDSGFSDFGIGVSGFRTVGPARLVTDLSLRWRANSCRRGSRYRGSWSFFPLLVSPEGRVDFAVADTERLGRGLRERTRGRMALMFFTRGRDYRVSGRWKVTTRVYRGGRLLDVCRTDKRFVAAGGQYDPPKRPPREDIVMPG